MNAQERTNATNSTNEITLAEAAEFVPRKSNGKKVHVRTLQRWIERGCRGVRLLGRKSGNYWYTTVEAIEQFRNATTQRAIAVAHPVGVAIPTQTEVKRQAKDTSDSLRRKGFKLDDHQEQSGKENAKQIGQPSRRTMPPLPQEKGAR